ncbi:MAG TPA: four-carbon acid sugar kinase family protein [Symbiobacteriaceae bacterium]|nr:four-carbon acid sugar kinase family protein [Symbiobacteriaceae bacterium]
MEEPQPLIRAEALSGLPPEFDCGARLMAALAGSRRKVVVLDDDPTGTQTVHNVKVVTRFSQSVFERCLREPGRVFYVLTNSRSLPEAEVVALTRRICWALCEAADATGVPVTVVCRSDSTLRGHFPAENDTVMQTMERQLGMTFRGTVLLPAFFEGGRYTLGGVHWVEQKGEWVPAGQTEFARDPAFGYRSSRLAEYVAEKAGGARPAVTIPLEVTRRAGPDGVAAVLAAAPPGSVIVPDAVTYADISVIVCALLEAEASGHYYSFRTAASFVPVCGGIAPRPLLTATELRGGQASGAGGLVVVGSHVSKTTAQLGALMHGTAISPVELVTARLLTPVLYAGEIARAAAAVSGILAGGRDAVLYTSRAVATGGGGSEYIDIARTVAGALIEVVRSVTVRPRFFVAKGGITSSTMATDALDVQAARVLGQVLPGIPVWELGPESRLPGGNFVVFPGNVGDEAALLQVVRKLQGRDDG